MCLLSLCPTRQLKARHTLLIIFVLSFLEKLGQFNSQGCVLRLYAVDDLKKCHSSMVLSVPFETIREKTCIFYRMRQAVLATICCIWLCPWTLVAKHLLCLLHYGSIPSNEWMKNDENPKQQQVKRLNLKEKPMFTHWDGHMNGFKSKQLDKTVINIYMNEMCAWVIKILRKNYINNLILDRWNAANNDACVRCTIHMDIAFTHIRCRNVLHHS